MKQYLNNNQFCLKNKTNPLLNNRTQSKITEILVLATMSAGKSTLINSLIRTKLLPSQNMACTAVITSIENFPDNKNSNVIQGLNSENKLIKELTGLTEKNIEVLNKDPNVKQIKVKKRISCIPESIKVALTDTPGTNSSLNENHKTNTIEKIKATSNALIVYVLNARHLGTADDQNLLAHVAKKFKNNPIVFVLNKIDCIDADTEDVNEFIKTASHYLESCGFTSPRIFPCSAKIGLTAVLNPDFDYQQLSKTDEELLTESDLNTVLTYKRFFRFEKLHLDQYTNYLSKIQLQDKEETLKMAKERKQFSKLIYIYSGLFSLEQEIKRIICANEQQN